jgi:predicted secreted protein
MSNAISSFGTLLKIGDGGGGGEVFTTIAEVLDINGPGIKNSVKEVTHQTSTGGFRERIATLSDAGEVTFDINFIPTENTQDAGAGLLKDAINRTLRNFKIVFPDTAVTTWAFSAFVTDFEPHEPVDGSLGASVTLTLTGKPTYA